MRWTWCSTGSDLARPASRSCRRRQAMCVAKRPRSVCEMSIGVCVKVRRPEDPRLEQQERQKVRFLNRGRHRIDVARRGARIQPSARKQDAPPRPSDTSRAPSPTPTGLPQSLAQQRFFTGAGKWAVWQTISPMENPRPAPAPHPVAPKGTPGQHARSSRIPLHGIGTALALQRLALSGGACILRSWPGPVFLVAHVLRENLTFAQERLRERGAGRRKSRQTGIAKS